MEICYPTPGTTQDPGNNSRSQKFWDNVMNSHKVKSFELIELPVPVNQGAGKIMFPDIPQLRNTMLKAIETWNVLNVSVSPNGLANISVADSAKAYIGLFIGGKDQIVRMPLVCLNRMAVSNATYGGATYDICQFEDLLGVDWSKSYLQFATAPVATAFAIMLGVHYA